MENRFASDPMVFQSKTYLLKEKGNTVSFFSTLHPFKPAYLHPLPLVFPFSFLGDFRSWVYSKYQKRIDDCKWNAERSVSS